jgi:hypothetical protein
VDGRPPLNSPPARGDAVPLTFDLDDDQHADLRWYLEEYMDLPDHGSRVRAQRIKRQIEAWGRALYDDVFAPQANADLLGYLLDGDGQPKLTVATDDACFISFEQPQSVEQISLVLGTYLEGEQFEQLDSPDAGPLQPLATYLRRLAATVPEQLLEQLAQPLADLPEPLPQIFAQLQQAVREAGLG